MNLLFADQRKVTFGLEESPSNTLVSEESKFLRLFECLLQWTTIQGTTLVSLPETFIISGVTTQAGRFPALTTTVVLFPHVNQIIRLNYSVTFQP